MPRKPKKSAKRVTRTTKVLAGAKGKLGKLTFKDIDKLLNRLKGYKGELPPGYSRKHCHACTCKLP